MPGLTIHRLTDPYALPAQLAAALLAAEAELDPLALVQVVLPAAAWRGWLSRALADRVGVLAGVELLSLEGFRRQLPSLAPGSGLARVLAMQAALADAARSDAMLAEWLARDPDGRWRIGLAQQLTRILAEDRHQRPLLAITDAEAAPAWWRALRATLPAAPAPDPLDAGQAPAALHWVTTTAPLAHDWAVLSGLSQTVPVTLWLLAPADPGVHHPLQTLLGAEPAPLPPGLCAMPPPLPASTAETGTLAPLRAALRGGRLPAMLPSGALCVGSAGSLFEQLRLAEAWLRERFAADPDLSPAEVLLLTPNGAEAAPLIDAVFGPGSGSTWPYRVAGRRQRSRAAGVLAALLDSPRRRWTGAELVALLRDPALCAGLGLDAGAANRLHARLAGLPGGWGLDGVSRADWQAGHDVAHTWQARWPVLSAQLASADPLQQALPRLCAALIGYREASRGERPLSAQRAALAALLDALLPARRMHPDADAVWQLWRGLLGELDQVAQDPALSQAAFASLLVAALPREAETPAPDRADTAGPEAGLRFAPLKAGAIRPARLIVLYGLDALDFPRRPAAGPLEDWRATLDALHPALAPPDAAAADRQLLLESLWMAADATLWLHADRDPRTGQPLAAPAPIEAALALLPGASRLPGLPPLRGAAGSVPRPAEAAEVPTAVSLAELCLCFRDPAQFQRDRVRRIELPALPLAEDGALGLTTAAAWQLRQGLLQRLDHDPAHALPEVPDAAQALLLPPGPAGQAAWERLCGEARALSDYHHQLLLDRGPPRDHDLDLEIDAPPLRLHGRLRVHARQLIERVAGVPQARHLVHAWVRALALATLDTDAADLVLVGLGTQGPTHLVIRLPDAGEAGERLGALLQGYARAWSQPLAFTPRLGLALVEGGDAQARWHWLGSEHEPGESQEPLNRWLWGSADPTAGDRLRELQSWSSLLLPARLWRPWRKHWT